MSAHKLFRFHNPKGHVCAVKAHDVVSILPEPGRARKGHKSQITVALSHEGHGSSEVHYSSEPVDVLASRYNNLVI